MYTQTPVIESPFFNVPNQVFLKLENTQSAGSFKLRGMSKLIDKSMKEIPSPHFYSSSGGNAGLAVANAASDAGRPATIVVPAYTSEKVVDKMKTWGAQVIKYGSMWSEADEHLREMMDEDPSAVYCHPFDNPVLWDGHGTLVDELTTQMDKPAAIVLSCGGGGLYLGVMTGLIRNGWTDVVVYVVETEGANCFNQSLKAGKQIVTGPPTSIAKSLGSTWVPQRALDFAKQYNVRSVLVSDEQALDECRNFARTNNMIIEPACGATLAAMSQGHIKEEGPILAVVCGGSLFSVEDLVTK